MAQWYITQVLLPQLPLVSNTLNPLLNPHVSRITVTHNEDNVMAACPGSVEHLFLRATPPTDYWDASVLAWDLGRGSVTFLRKRRENSGGYLLPGRRPSVGRSRALGGLLSPTVLKGA